MKCFYLLVPEDMPAQPQNVKNKKQYNAKRFSAKPI